MTADGFLNQKQRHPIAMTAAIAINAAAITALLLAKAGVVVLPPGAIPLIPITEPPIPEPIDEVAQKHPVPDPPIYVPPRRVPTNDPVDDPAQVDTGDKPTDTGSTSEGTSGGARAGPEPKPEPLPLLTDAVPLPRAAGEFQPPYPPQLLRTNVEGKAVVRVLIGTDGRVKQVAIISADDPLFADATERQALRKWRFKPVTRDGQPVETWKQMTVRFEIRT